MSEEGHGHGVEIEENSSREFNIPFVAALV